MEKKIRLGIFGLCRGSAFFDIIATHGGDVVAICDKEPKRLARALEKMGDKANCVTVYRDFDDFINHDMDAVFLANHFNEHAPFAIRCLEKGLHVLSECTACGTLAEGVALCRAAEKSNAIYMLSENYPFMKFNQEMKRVYDGGTLGKVMYAEGEYNHPVGPDDTKFLTTYRPYELHWRNYHPATYYITHSLAPIMYATGSNPIRVTAMPVYAPLSDDYAHGMYVADQAAIITCLNDNDSVFKVTGCSKFGAHGSSYRICGDKGMIENVRGSGGMVMLRYNSWDVPEGMEKDNYYMPDWPADEKEAIEASGHGGGDYFVIKRFFECIRNGENPEFDVYFATRLSAVGILAHRSLLEYGVPYDIPDFSKEEDRVKYENDRITPYPKADGTMGNIACCSHPDYKPSEVSLEKYRAIINKK